MLSFDLERTRLAFSYKLEFSSRNSLIPTFKVVATGPLVVLLRKSRGECSRSGPSDGITRIHDIYAMDE